MGWGIGEDDGAGNPQGSTLALGIFYLRAAQYLPMPRCLLVLCGVLCYAVLACVLPAFAQVPEDESEMKRRQQGILTGMPFMANITPDRMRVV